MINNYNDLKLLSRKELLKLLPEGFKFKTKPWTHQIAGTIGGIYEDGFLEALDLGTGKTKVAIDVCRYYAMNKKDFRVLFVCMNSAVEKIADEVNLHSKFKATCLRGSSQERWDKIKGNGFFIINYEALRFMLCAKLPSCKCSTKSKMVVDQAMIRKILAFKFDYIIIDESHKVKDIGTLNFKMLKPICRAVKKVLLLTGTPFEKNLLNIWSQYFLIDGGSTYGTSITRFKEDHFEDVGFWGSDWKVTKEGRKIIEKKLFRKAIRYEESEVNDLPKKNYRIIYYDLSDKQKLAYQQALEGIDFDGKQLVNKTIALRQICGGTLKAGDTIFRPNPKLKVIENLLETTVNSRKVVIFYEFRLEYLVLAQLLNKMIIKYSTLNGDVKPKDRSKMIKRFNKNSAYRVILVHPEAGSTSIDLIGGNYMLFYSNGHKVINRKQAEKRINRSGQKRKCFYYDFIAKNTIEVGLHDALIKGKDFFKEVMDKYNMEKLLKGE